MIMNFRRSLLMSALALGLAGCASYPMYSQVGVGYYDDGYSDGYYGYGGYGGYGGYYGYGGYPYFGWSGMYPFGGYCPARYGYCPPYGFGAFIDPYYYGFGLFMPYGYGSWYGPYWNGYGHPRRHHDGGHSHDGDDHDGDHDNRPPNDDGHSPPPAPTPRRREWNRPLPRPDPMAEDAGPYDGSEPREDAVASSFAIPEPVTGPQPRAGQIYRPAPATRPPSYRPPPAAPPPGGTRPEPTRREMPAPEPRPRAQGSSDDSDTDEPKRGSGKRRFPDGASK